MEKVRSLSVRSANVPFFHDLKPVLPKDTDCPTLMPMYCNWLGTLLGIFAEHVAGESPLINWWPYVCG